MRKYELILVFTSELDDASVQTEVSKVSDTIKAHHGTVVREEVWGRKQLAYRIHGREFGIYVYLVLEADHGVVAELERQLRINESVLRFLCVKKDKFAPDAVARPKMADDGAELEEPGIAEFSEDDESSQNARAS